jgi:cell division protein FtsZ
MSYKETEIQHSSHDMFTIVDDVQGAAVIKVVGVGGGGGNAIQHMLAKKIEGVEFICANTDAQALQKHNAPISVQLGSSLTRGLGAGAKPEVGRQAALDDRERIAEVLKGADMVFITAGMGGGTGTGAAPVVAEVAKELGILTVAVVTKPFTMEGGRRMQMAEAGLEEMARHVDSLITIPNQKLLQVLGSKVTLLDAFAEANNVLLNAVQGIAELITREGMINVDFADVKTVMSEMGMAMMGAGSATGEGRAVAAAEAAVSSPLLEDVDLSGARGILINVTSGPDLTLEEYEQIGATVRAYASDDATIIVGTVIDFDIQDEIRVTVVATGLNRPSVAPRVAVDNTRTQERTDNEARRAERVPQRRVAGSDTTEGMGASRDLDYLDIPAFLRKQAD